MVETGFVVGKFYPPHRGHKYLIDTARASVDRLTVMVCGKPGDEIPYQLRAQWLREIHPDVTVIEILDSDLDDDDSQAWAGFVRETLGYVPNVVFTSEDYGALFCRFLGARHVLVDKQRAHVPCSGTAVRDDPFAQWDFLEPCVRAYFVKRICVVGAESTGTTTMARALAVYYETIWVPEYGREYCEAKFTDGITDNWDSEEFTHIAAKQCEMEDAAAREANKILICDTAAFATSIWHKRYLGARSPDVDAIAAERRYDLFLLTDVDIPFVQDGTRDGEHIRHTMHEWFVEWMVGQGVPYAILFGLHEVRLAKAISLIDELLLKPA